MQTYGVFYATSFLDLYRRPRQLSAASLSLTVVVDGDEQYLFLVSPSPKRSSVSQYFHNIAPFASRSEPSHPSWDPRLTSRWSK